jgi:long-subunit fatty acid transport protein
MFIFVIKKLFILKRIQIIILIASLCLFLSNLQAQLVPNLGGQRAGISSLQFLKIGADARGAGMGEACVAVSNDIGAVFWNPAGLVNSEHDQIVFSHAEWLVDIQHEFAAASYHLDENNVMALSVISLHTDPMQITTETNPTGTGNYFNYSDFSFGTTISRKMTDQFNFGLTIRYVRETSAEVHTDAFLVDIGTFYYMGLGSSRFSVVVSNFGNNVSPHGMVITGKNDTVNNFQDYSPPTMFKLGFAFDPVQTDVHKITASIQLNHPNDNGENIRLGLEYEFDKTFYLRTGIKRTIGESLLGKAISTAEDISLGTGIKISTEFSIINFDYAYTNFNDLGSVHRISISLTY